MVSVLCRSPEANPSWKVGVLWTLARQGMMPERRRTRAEHWQVGLLSHRQSEGPQDPDEPNVFYASWVEECKAVGLRATGWAAQALLGA